jgi:predicted dehydrogenase/aryl-alcohol dehydrogenase-like predicted oxidoreductase
MTNWGIIGPGSIAGNFAQGLKESASGKLVAIASRDSGRRAEFGDKFGVAADKRYGDYAAILKDQDVQAIYIATPHPWHCELALSAIRAGKAVLVEKPAGLNAAEVVLLTEAARQEGVFFMEAFMYRCHPQIARLLEIIASGEIGTIHHMRINFGFNAPNRPGSRLYEKSLAGGGIYDVGGYPVSLARLVAGAAVGQGFAEPVEVKGAGLVGETGVDEAAYGLLRFASGITAEVAVAVARNMDNRALIHGDKGMIEVVDPWTPGRNAGPSDAVIRVTVGKDTREIWLRDEKMLFAFEAELASTAIADGLLEAPYPAMNWAESIGNNTVLDRWRAEVGVVSIADEPTQKPVLKGAIPAHLPRVTKAQLPGVDLPVSRLIIGCDNKDGIAEGAVVWDAWLEAGGNAFDTAFVYGGGRHETVLGQWIASRGVAKDIVVIAKGAHSPYCLPGAIGPQLDQSLARLGLDRVPVYIMHRDNPEVPVGEFVEALNDLRKAGKIGVFGGSNWSPARVLEANAYAAARGLQGMTILNNNLSLATMIKPVWAGCVTSNTPETLAMLRQGGVAHVSWSSQARGYFLPEELRNRLPEDTAPETCFGGPENAERRQRAEALAARLGVSAHNIATAWVLSQAFPSFALIGPRTVGEIVSTLPGLGLELSPEQVAWLNLERDSE